MGSSQNGSNQFFVKQRRIRLLKIGLAAFAVIGLCGWAVYRWLNPPSEFENDFTVKSAIAWLENADAGKFDVCRKNIADGEWFTWFEKDRTSLGKNGRRELFQRQETGGATGGMKRYELKFDTRFNTFKNPKSQVTERVVIDSDGRKNYQVVTADFWLRRAFDKPLGRTPSKEEMESISLFSKKVLDAVEGANTDFFRENVQARAKSPDYFGWKKYTLNDSRNEKRIKDLGVLFRNQKTSPRKPAGAGIIAYRGRMGVEMANVRYQFSAGSGARIRKYILVIALSRDFYQDKSAPWRFEYIYSNEIKKEK